MSRKKTILIGLLLGLFVVTGSLVVWAQVAGEDVGRDIMKMARQKKTGETEPQPIAQVEKPAPTTAAKAEEPVRSTPPPPAVAPAPAAVGADDVLSLLPADCLFCVRINKLDTSLGSADLYIAGVSPVPVSLAMLAKMQIGNLLSDPMLTGVNTQGDFAIFGTLLPAEAGAMPQVAFGMLVPVSGEEFFQKYQDSQLPGGKYALISLEPTMAQSLAAVKKQMASPLARGLSADLAGQSRAAPMWAYANIAGAVKVFGPMLFAQLDQMAAKMPQAQPGMEANAKMLAAYIGFVKTYATQLDSLTVVLDPRPDTLDAAITLSALPNTDLANLLVRDPAMKSGYSMAGFLNEPAAINVLGKINRPMYAKLNNSVIALFAEALPGIPAEAVAKWKTMAASSMDLTGDEFAVSFSLAAGMPPVDLKEIVQVKDGAAMMAMMSDGLAIANEMYKAMGMEASIGLTAGDTYKQSQIYSMKFDMKLPPDTPEQERQMFEQMMGSGFNYRLAVASGYMLVTGGPEADADIRALIDQAAASTRPAPTADIQTVLAAVPNASAADFVVSINVPRLVSGIGGMLSTMPVPNGQMIGSMFSKLEVPTTSCIGLAGTAGGGRATLQIVVPKQHLLEIVGMVAAMQQNMMQQQQNMTQPGGPAPQTF